MTKEVKKRIMSFILLVCFVFLTGALSGCSENLNYKLVGKWERNWSSEEIIRSALILSISPIAR